MGVFLGEKKASKMDRGKQCNKVKSVGREGEGFCCYSTSSAVGVQNITQ